jgi:hypothetical protein
MQLPCRRSGVYRPPRLLVICVSMASRSIYPRRKQIAVCAERCGSRPPRPVILHWIWLRQPMKTITEVKDIAVNSIPSALTILIPCKPSVYAALKQGGKPISL